ncbi:MAG: hypothetical protein KUA35_06990 [Pseudodesulfovibrio sp.]|uniref:Uncharacterized protein n=1 Tax=Pseudodesulfovibrio aespoeensis (strain ATCC 700646 / DSM 10631 / Aspo-2) TaxID=643562 RepID=E6VZB5_PSEA9|nr:MULTISPECIES: hypothetical protein [Pseudodesulfovibrio]MBU4192392.1 hypothetical protein [Pseudomonadota bacterium]ADU63987.1 hypothetical protein Daes_2993 [Pseudodesulfovibrio aespoeensis Aspo-2]MBU4243859.1 hypothetical protein [Pseudomonadota bacterium]MBU4475401.1 hypothetical protein [Pseudomonadota bacterium]MBU4517238.1 hypothetical protein [Pseudomonadota bacterium]
MDKPLEDSIRALAGEHGIDPQRLLAGFASVDMPPELALAVAAVLGDIDAFAASPDSPASSDE